ncbi:AAA family ATPase [Metabacillus endolithicus]|uniref:AAA family ATPase n=1 Tax=Metabacillus endolithicus TaxID=1535204 RepID=A0ABW5BU18_9BACI
MSKERWQVDYDGNLVWKDAVSSKIRGQAKAELIKELFERDGWECKILHSGSKFTKVKITHSHTHQTAEYNVALVNVVNETRQNSNNQESPSSYEKRIQGDGLYDADCDNKLVFGLYIIEEEEHIDDSIITSIPEEALTSGSNRAYRVNVKEIQPTRTVGLYVDPNSAYDVVTFKPENIHLYLKNRYILHRHKRDTREVEMPTNEENVIIPIERPYNRIFFGAPGTGKSFKINEDREGFFPSKEQYDRVTFHPNYSYSHFVGTYKPTPKEDDDQVITYNFVPGPFLKLWVESKRSMQNDDGKNYLLIIEEINRANTAAVFGDVFQLLDRKQNGYSEYEIYVSEDIKRYLKNEFSKPITENEWFNKLNEEQQAEHISTIKLQPNMYLWCTMNSADQGVFPMDTAFKRRWNFEYIGLNDSEEKNERDVQLANGKFISWNALRRAINKELGRLKYNEDKMLGPFFLSKDDIENNFDTAFKSKLLMYLYEDVIKHSRDEFFKNELNTYSQLLESYRNGEEIFKFDLDYKYPENIDSPEENGIKAAETKSEYENNTTLEEANEVEK